MTTKYNTGGTTSSLGGTVDGKVTGQLSGDFFYQKKALIELAKEQYFSQLADVTSMPKNMGKKIKRYIYLPMIDDRNINDQGIDAAGAQILTTEYYVTMPDVPVVANTTQAAAIAVINANINAYNATTFAKTAEVVAAVTADGTGGTGFSNITLTKRVIRCTLAQADAIVALAFGAVKSQGSGNLYGTSKDVGAISGKLPSLSETGGRVNKVGFKRKELEGTFAKFGFFDEYTQESMDFDSDADLMMHINREMLRGANELTEDALQVDLLTAAGTVKFAGGYTIRNRMVSSATAALDGVVTYKDLMRLGIDLDNNRTPKKITMITGSRMVDTKTLPAARVMYIGSELLPTVKAMTDLFGSPAFVPVEKYAEAGSTVNGEVGSVDAFRLVVVPEMAKWVGGGGPTSAGSNPTLYYSTGGRFDVFPMLVVGEESFTTIGFQTDGKSVKFNIMHKKPGLETADRNDPFGETGFMSIKWYYGFMALRPERIALLHTLGRI